VLALRRRHPQARRREGRKAKFYDAHLAQLREDSRNRYRLRAGIPLDAPLKVTGRPRLEDPPSTRSRQDYMRDYMRTRKLRRDKSPEKDVNIRV
jgi:hypothetical protein